MDPNTIVDLVYRSIEGIVDKSKWTERYNTQEGHRNQLMKASQKWDDITPMLNQKTPATSRGFVVALPRWDDPIMIPH